MGILKYESLYFKQVLEMVLYNTDCLLKEIGLKSSKCMMLLLKCSFGCPIG